jgi:hypothetical protein
MEWWHSSSSQTQKIKYKIPLEKLSPRIFGIKTASSSMIIFQKGQTINGEYYSSLLVQLKKTLKEKRHAAGR